MSQIKWVSAKVTVFRARNSLLVFPQTVFPCWLTAMRTETAEKKIWQTHTAPSRILSCNAFLHRFLSWSLTSCTMKRSLHDQYQPGKWLQQSISLPMYCTYEFVSVVWRQVWKKKIDEEVQHNLECRHVCQSSQNILYCTILAMA